MAFCVKLIVPVSRIRLNIFPSDCIFREGGISYMESYQYVFILIDLMIQSFESRMHPSNIYGMTYFMYIILLVLVSLLS